MPCEIDRDVDLHLAQPRRHFVIAGLSNIDEALERAFEAGAHRSTHVGTEGHGDRFEPSPIMPLEQPGRQPCRRMIVEVRGDVGNANPVVLVPLPRP